MSVRPDETTAARLAELLDMIRAAVPRDHNRTEADLQAGLPCVPCEANRSLHELTALVKSLTQELAEARKGPS